MSSQGVTLPRSYRRACSPDQLARGHINADNDLPVCSACGLSHGRGACRHGLSERVQPELGRCSAAAEYFQSDVWQHVPPELRRCQAPPAGIVLRITFNMSLHGVTLPRTGSRHLEVSCAASSSELWHGDKGDLNRTCPELSMWCHTMGHPTPEPKRR